MKIKSTGSGLIFAVVLLFVILGMVITLASVTILETKMSQKTKSSVGAFYGAESGVEWALNKIATGTGTTINGNFGVQATNAAADGKISCPFEGCGVYLLGADGKVIPKAQFSVADSADLVKAVRSIGTQGDETQRAIEAAVAATGGGCYVSYSGSCLSGFTSKGSLGSWGYCIAHSQSDYNSVAYNFPPGGHCFNGWSEAPSGVEAILCCQN